MQLSPKQQQWADPLCVGWPRARQGESKGSADAAALTFSHFYLLHVNGCQCVEQAVAGQTFVLKYS